LEWVNDSCDRFKVNLLLIEAAGPGLSADGGVRQELAAGIIQSARDFPIGKISGLKAV
jgi:hypothetical protein